MKLKGKTILLISPEAWGPNHVSKHHYANYLAKENTVYFLNPPQQAQIPARQSIKVQSLSLNLYSVDYHNLLPKLNLLPKFLQERIYKKMAKQIVDHIGLKTFDIIWTFDPYRFFNQKIWPADNKIYHTVDVHFRTCFESDMAKTSDLVLLSSECLRANLSSHNDNIHYSGHAADIDQFSLTTNTPLIQLPGQHQLKAGLVGNFNHNVDYDLIEKIALHNPNIDFIFVGPYTNNNLGNDAQGISDKIEKLTTLNNVFFVGAVPSNQIINWLKIFDINLVLYREDKRDIIINPHKMMGYFYAGHLTICSWFNEYKNSPKELVYMVDSNQNIPEAIASISQNLTHWNHPDLIKARREFALANSYDKKIEYISNLIYKD